jgi:hypothetical protein
MLTPQRARQIIRAQSDFPYWGNYSKFMTAEENAYALDRFKLAKNGNVSIASIVHECARADMWERPAHFDDRDAEIVLASVVIWNERGGPRVGDWCLMPDGDMRRFTYAWDDGIQTTIRGSTGGDGFYFNQGYLSFSGSLDRSIPFAWIFPTDEIKPGRAWCFHHNEVRAHNGVYFTVPCRVFVIRP